VFHVEFRQFPNVARAFNLSRQELMTRIVAPWVSGASVHWNERSWNPEKARIVIYEGPALAPAEIGLGRGWANASRGGTEVTQRVLDEARVPPALESFKSEVSQLAATEPVPLSALVPLAAERHPQARASEQLGLAEDAVWQLLHEQRVILRRHGEPPLPQEEWSALLLRWDTWTVGTVMLEGPP
jgi:hypothetical protein